jgi:hypothetical protein
MAHRWHRFPLVVLAAALTALAIPASAGAANLSFSNATAISVGVPPGANPGAGSPYPSSIGLSGVTGTTLKATVTLNGVNRSFVDEMDVLLVGPQGQRAMLFSDACGLNNPNGSFTFDDAAAATLSDAGPCTPGTFAPSDFADSIGDVVAEMAAPAPAGPYGTSLAAFNGASPNGTWSLFAQDDRTNDGGTITGGWTLNLTVTDPAPVVVPVAVPVPAATPTGQRAAAIKKCKKKFPKGPKRKKCIKKAKRLPI